MSRLMLSLLHFPKALFLCAVIVLVTPFLHGETVPLESKLACIKSDAASGKIDLGTAERQCLSLLHGDRSPQERGKVYAAIAFAYSQAGPHEYWAEVIEYSKMAADSSLSTLEAALTHRLWGEAVCRKYDGLSKDQFEVCRRGAARLFLLGLQRVLAECTGNAMQHRPNVSTFFLPKGHPGYSQALKRYQEQIAARRAVRFQNQLVRERCLLSGRIISLYTTKPYAVSELRRLVSKILGDGQGGDEIVADVEARINGGKGIDWHARMRRPAPPPMDPKVRAWLTEVGKREAAKRKRKLGGTGRVR